MTRTLKIVLWSAIALVIVGLLAWPKIRPDSSGQERVPSGGGGTSQGFTATAYIVQPMHMTDRVRATGTLQADESVDLSAEVAGRVTGIFFREGSSVSRGQLLVQLNDAELQAQRERLRYRIELAETREERQRRLLEIGGVSRDEYDGALGELNVLRAELNLVDAQLARMEIRAPFSGIIGLRHISEGAYVAPQTQIATLQALSPMKLEFSVPERYAPHVQIGHTIEFTIAGSESTFEGVVYAFEPNVSIDTRTLLIRARVSNPRGELLPGSFADLEMTIHEIPDALPIPTTAIVQDLEGARVWLVENGRASSRIVETGLRTDNTVQITQDGIAQGDTVLVTGLQAAREGLPVRILSFETIEGTDGDQPDPIPTTAQHTAH